MIVSNNTLLNILIPNNNPALKNVLKQADAQQLTTLSKSSGSVQDIIKNLFNDTIKGTKSNETILNLLKNSNVFKDMGNFTTQLKDLQNMIKDDPKLSKYETYIKSFLVNIKNADDSTLKEQIGKSGVFLESKISDTLKTNNLPNKIQNILVQLKQELSKVDSPQVKEISTFIDKLLNTKTHTKNTLTTDLKTLSNNIKNISELKNSPQIQNLVNLTTQLKSLNTETQLLGAKIQNNQNANAQVSQNIELKSNSLGHQTEIKNTAPAQIKELLTNLKQLLSNVNLPKSVQLSNEIKNILSQKEIPVQTLLNQTKSLVSQLQNFIINQPTGETLNKISQQTNALKMLAYNTPKTNTKITLDTPITNDIKNNQTVKINELLTTIKQTLSNLNLPKANILSQEIDNMLTQKNTPPQSLSNQTKSMVSQLQNFIINQPSSPEINALKQLTHNLKMMAYEPVQTKSIPTNQSTQSTQSTQGTPNQNIQNNTNLNVKFSSILNAIKTELLNSNVPLTKDAVQIIDKLLSQPNLTPNIQSFQSSINTLLTTIKTLLTNLPSQSNIVPEQIYKLINQLENSIKPDSPLINEKSLKQNPELLKSNITNDIKSILLKLGEELKQTNNPISNETYKQVDKLLMQIDYHQLISLTSSSNHLYLPFVWDMLEDGSIETKKLNEEKFYVEINLKLKEFGKINLLLVMYDKNHLDISIFAQKQILKDEIMAHLQGLKKSLSSIGIIPGSIKLLDLKEDDEKKEEHVYEDNNSEQLGFGINIKV